MPGQAMTRVPGEGNLLKEKERVLSSSPLTFLYLHEISLPAAFPPALWEVRALTFQSFDVEG